MSPRPERPSDADYHERDRVELLSQGDLFRDVPLAYPLPADELVVDEERGGGRRFLSGPLEFGPAMLITPSYLRRFDHLINYVYLPPLEVDELEFSMPESVALLYMPVTLHQAFLEGQRVSQLAYRGAQQLQRKLVWFYSGWLEENLDSFDPPMD
ncbi:MAG: hypothetical protein M3P41_10255 [Actinomycetota bacterium]|nr:hypothetical protein [Actinomycetota bacterium]